MRKIIKKKICELLRLIAWVYIFVGIPICILIFLYFGTNREKISLVGMTFAMASCYLKLSKSPVVLEPNKRLCDNIFVNREDERGVLMEFVKENDKQRRIFYVTGSRGIGKTELLLRFAQDLEEKNNFNNKLFINKLNDFFKSFRFKGMINIRKKITVYYVEIEGKDISILSKCIEKLEITDQIGGEEKLAKVLDESSIYPKILLILDGIDRNSKKNAEQFAKCLINSSKNISIIIGITMESVCPSQTIELYGNLQPSIFKNIQLNELEVAYNISLDTTNRDKILKLSGGIPSYVRLLMNLRAQNKQFELSAIGNIDEMIKLQYDSFDDISKQIIEIMSYLKLLGVDSLPEENILKIIKDCALYYIELVLDSSLVYRENTLNKRTIRMHDLVAESCRKFCNKNQTLMMIKKYYENSNKPVDSTLLMLSDRTISSKKGRKILKELLNSKKFLIIERLWRYDKMGYLNSSWKNDVSNVHYFNYCYLESLLQLGQYRRACSELSRLQSLDSELPILRSGKNMTQDDFDMQFLILNLHHLNNQFFEALTEIEVFMKQLNTDSNRHKLLYLKAHIMKHQGVDLPCADSILRDLSKYCSLSNEFKIQIIYSRIAIHLFWGTPNFEYESHFLEIDKISKQLNESPVKMHAERHRAIYTLKIKRDINAALAIINNALSVLEKKQFRIIYDFYFEKAEMLRIKYYDINENYMKYKDEIISLYNKSIAFAEENNDLNLKTMSELGIVLTLYKCSDYIYKDDLIKKVDSIINSLPGEHDNNVLLINYYTAMYVKNLLEGSIFTSHQISHFENLRYNDFLYAMKNGDVIKLTVM